MEALGLNPGSIAIHALNFIILLFVLQRFLYKPVIGMFDDRAGKIREGVEAADRARAESARAEQARAIRIGHVWHVVVGDVELRQAGPPAARVETEPDELLAG